MLQCIQLLQFLLQIYFLHFQFRQQTFFIKATFVFKVLQFLCQIVGCTAFITGGHQFVQPTAQRFILGDRHFRKFQKTCPGKYTFFHTQQHLSRCGNRQLRNRYPGMGLKGLDLTKRHTALVLTLNGNFSALPYNLHGTGHGRAGPGSIMLLIRQKTCFGAGTGVNAVEHSHEESTPCAFAPFVGSFDNIQS